MISPIIKRRVVDRPHLIITDKEVKLLGVNPNVENGTKIG